MGETIRADAALLAAVEAGDGATLHTEAGAVVSWPALHLLAVHGFRWAPSDPGDADSGPSGTRLHVELTIEHAAHAGLVLAATPARFIERSLGTELAFSLAEGSSRLAPDRLTAMAERRSPRDATFVVTGAGSRALGGVLTVQRGPRSVLESLRCMVALPGMTDDLRAVRDALEAGLQSVMLGRHPRSAQFSTSRGRVDGVVDTAIAGPPAPLGVFSGTRETRARGLAVAAASLGGHTVGPGPSRGVVFWFDGTEQARWSGAAALASGLRDLQAGAMHSGDLRRRAEVRHDGTRTGGQ
ncbi:DUF6177 family protein [Curtobacterium sp. L1-20]|uniref:DUF6177 family protein n=1 Tax=Curtobacterium sp. L1-20 TaxID=3138181 RepID=UPI003B52BF63